MTEAHACVEAEIDACSPLGLFSAGRCRRHYNRYLESRRNAGEEIRPGPAPRLPNELRCSGCPQIMRASPAQLERAAAGRAVYHSRECQKLAAQVALHCAGGCGEVVWRYRSAGFDEESRAFCKKPECRAGTGARPRRGTSRPCGACGKDLYRPPGLGEGPRYCDNLCRAVGISGERVERPEVPCATCGDLMRLEPDQVRNGVRTHAGPCTAAARRRKPGERYIDPQGYAIITTPDGRSMGEHRWVMEQLIGRPLRPEETVHHKTGGQAGRSDNRPENLELWTGNHPKGHRVADVVAYAVEVLALYRPDLLTPGAE